ncbi:phenylacetate--CoA ligase family protein [Flavobacterium sp.]|uniref:phenylacetate--CoA ligase family protein n=1 Tax=Flavobacterium sp. TaxID=239 RepID=UPI0011F895A2|nr:phenylacetate--CoA ligase family protein [Flavobacterium sp.]RZJ71980.1 MAG: phenylacetate--CoA ligase family protein [Flavobacterium sp.]
MPGIFDLSLQLNGYPLKWAKLELRKILAVPDSHYADFLEQRKKDIVDYHFKHNAFYREISQNSSFEKWEDLPVMQKRDFQRPLGERLSKAFRESMVFVNKTSGSSGNPMTFAKDKACHAMVWANIQRRFGWFGIDFNNSWQARFYGRSLDVAASRKLQVKDFLSKRHRFDIFDLSDDALEKITSKFSKTKFGYINGYTSNIVLLAKYLKKKNIVLKDICPTLKVCITTSEMLFPDDRKLLETQLGIPIANEYGASELEVIAFENPEGEWLVNSETIFVEILDDEGKVLPHGQEGRIVVTSLDNKAHPFIRYDVGDRGILDEKSTPKKPILKKLVGRTSDFALLPSGKKPAGMTFYSLTKKIFEDDGNVGEFVIRQTEIDKFEIDYTSRRQLTEGEENRISKIMTDYLEPGLTFAYNRKPTLERTSAGKLKQFTNLVKSGNR